MYTFIHAQCYTPARFAYNSKQQLATTAAVASTAAENYQSLLHQRQYNSSDTSNAAVMCMKCHAIDHQPGSEMCGS